MSYEDRKRVIERVQEIRNSKVISYVCGDRQTRIPIPGMGTQLASEPQLIINEHLLSIGKVEKIDLFLYTRGGETSAVWPFVNSIREFCSSFSVLVPFRAHSGGTLICLGADEIVMAPFAELSPVDPTTGNQFSPVDKLNPKQRLGISVEDVISYISLAKDEHKVGITDESGVLEVFKSLAQEVHPLALGNVQRVHTHIRLLAHKLLALGSHKVDDKKADEIVDVLTEKLYSHSHAIGRREAQSLLDSTLVKFPSDEESQLMWELFEQYAEVLALRERFNIKEYMGGQNQRDITVIGAFLESEDMSHIFECTSMIYQRSELPSNFQIQVQAGQPIPLIPGFPTGFNIELVSEGWKSNERGV